jgi:hypothetical protein
VLRVESLDYDPAEAVGKIDGFRRSKTCKGPRLEGGECDSVHVFWNHKTKRLNGGEHDAWSNFTLPLAECSHLGI